MSAEREKRGLRYAVEEKSKALATSFPYKERWRRGGGGESQRRRWATAGDSDERERKGRRVGDKAGQG